ncbi:MAG: PilZ domain-containing protein [Deltaproteobacteria bacterium]|nr:PilZ domain-containing protein [Deltaproteobacteria bacterium]MBW2497310.1 PilZ domain-containing protein [Deltaproteobacteria bacterium]
MTRRTPKNTRRHRRMTVRILVDYQVRGAIHCDYATTLGAGGMFLQTEVPLNRGEVVKLRFRIPGGEALHELEARVKWCHVASPDSGDELRTPGAGLQFSDTSATATLARELEDYAASI